MNTNQFRWGEVNSITKRILMSIPLFEYNCIHIPWNYFGVKCIFCNLNGTLKLKNPKTIHNCKFHVKILFWTLINSIDWVFEFRWWWPPSAWAPAGLFVTCSSWQRTFLDLVGAMTLTLTTRLVFVILGSPWQRQPFITNSWPIITEPPYSDIIRERGYFTFVIYFAECLFHTMRCYCLLTIWDHFPLYNSILLTKWGNIRN